MCTSKKTEAKKLSFLKKLRPKNEKKLKTEAKKLRSPEAVYNDLSQKNSVYWRPYQVISAQKTQKTKKKLKTEPKNSDYRRLEPHWSSKKVHKKGLW